MAGFAQAAPVAHQSSAIAREVVSRSPEAAPAIVMLTERVLFPIRNGSQRRIVALIQSLRVAGFAVVLVSRRTLRLSRHPGIRATLRTRALVDHVLPADAPHFAGGSPMAYDSAPFLEPLSRAVRRFKPVAVIAEYIWMAPCLDVVPAGTLRVLDTHDLMHVRKAMYEGQPEGAWVECSREEEQSLLAKADVVMAIQRHEAEVFRGMVPTKTVIHVPHCCEVRDTPLGAGTNDVVVFVGSTIEGNLLGLRAFLDTSWPIVRRFRPDAQLRIYGDIAGCIPARPDGVHAIGYVRNLMDAYRDASVVINPVALGTGLKVKSVEALAYGKALVTTSCGAEGLEDGRQGAFMLEDDPERFGHAVARLLDDENARTGLARRALAFARARFSPAAALDELLAVVPTRSSSV